MTALDQQIGTGNHPAVWRWKYGTVVADAKHAGQVWRQYCANGGNKAELTEIGDGNDVLLNDPLAADRSAPLR
jgi:hypothetical protein